MSKSTTGKSFTDKPNTGLANPSGNISFVYQAGTLSYPYSYTVTGSWNYFNQVAPPIVLAPRTQVAMKYRWNLAWNSPTTFPFVQAVAYIRYPLGCPDTREWHRMDSSFNPTFNPSDQPVPDYSAGYVEYLSKSDIDNFSGINPVLETWVNTRAGVNFVDEVYFRGSVTVRFVNDTDRYAGFIMGRQIGLRLGSGFVSYATFSSDVTTPQYLWNCQSVTNGKTIGQTALYIRDLIPLYDFGVSAGWGMPASHILP